MRHYLILIFLLFFCGAVSAQSVSYQFVSPARNSSEPGVLQKLNIEQDSRLKQLVETHVRNNEKLKGISGYRVEIFFSSSMNALEKAQQAKTEFLRENSDNKVYISYNSPDFKVRVGNFRTKSEALKLMKKIQGQFPKAFIVPDIIEFPSLN